MKNFPVIDHIREIRKKISEEHGHDTEELIKHYQKMEKNTGRKIFKREIRQEKAA